MDKGAIELIQKSEAITAAQSTIKGLGLLMPATVLPDDYSVKNLESMLPGRVRYRGRMNTKSIRDYIAFCKLHGELGSSCFVDADNMTATTRFNLGSKDKPGHGDFGAILTLEKTAEFRALLRIDGQRMSQKDMAEFLEDYADEIVCFAADGESIKIATAIAAIRKVTIESRNKLDSEEGNFNSKRSAMEEIEAKSELGLPHGFRFECVPYNGLGTRSFELRLSVLTGGDRPQLAPRIKRLEAAEQEMSEEFHGLLEAAFDGTDIETFIGNFDL